MNYKNRRKETYLAIILRLFNLLKKIPCFFTFYLWLKFVIYGKKPPTNQVKAFQIQKYIIKNKLEIDFTNNRIEIEGDSSDLRFTFNMRRYYSLDGEKLKQLKIAVQID